MYGLFLVGGCVNLYLYLTRDEPSYIIWTVIGFGYLLFIYIYLYRFAYAKDKEDFLSEKQLFFNDSTIRIEEADGGFGEFPFTRINRIIDKGTFWMLYISKNQFLYIPKDIFYSEEDFERFQQSIYITLDD